MSTKIIGLLLIGFLTSGCDLYSYMNKRATAWNNYEDAALGLAKENRQLRAELSKVKFDLEELKAQNDYLKLQLEKKKGTVKREIASVAPVVAPEKDLVKFDVYKWSPSQMLAIAEKEFDKKNYSKAAQYFTSFGHHYPAHEKINDQFLFQAGVSAYESGEHHEWVLKHLGKLTEEYPASPFYRGAKLWMALTHLKLGHNDQFFATVEEFRKKYRNTPEWKILSGHYEKIVHKYKSN